MSIYYNVLQSISPLERELQNKNIQLNDMCSQLKQKDQLSTNLRDSLDREKSKMIEMEKHVDMCQLLQQQLKQQDEKVLSNIIVNLSSVYHNCSINHFSKE